MEDLARKRRAIPPRDIRQIRHDHIIYVSHVYQQVAAQKNTFEAFLGTITIGEGQGAKP